MTCWQIDPTTPSVALMARWLDQIRNEVDATTLGLYELHCRTHLAPHFPTLDTITPANIATYGRNRLGKVKRVTLKKERSTLRRFLAWCEEQGYVDQAPPLPVLPARAIGTPHHQRRRGRATELTVEETRALIDALPIWSNPRNAAPFPVKPRFVVAYETTLRPSTLSALSVPEHYTLGALVLIVTDEIDKARFGRELPLSAEARAALDAVAPEAGLIFGKHDYREQLKKAAEKVLAPHKAATFAAYDLRHGRLTQLAETGNLPGLAHLAGHKRVSTTALYVRPGRRAAERVLAAAGPTGFQAIKQNPTSASRRLAGLAKPSKGNPSCEGEDSNLHGSYPASTSRQGQLSDLRAASTVVAPDLALVDLLRSEAQSLLGSAAQREPAELARLQGFARACLELTDVGRLALAVLDGGLFAPRRALELAEHIMAATGEVAAAIESRSAVAGASSSSAAPALHGGKEARRTR